jgi:hypothetical protein
LKLLVDIGALAVDEHLLDGREGLQGLVTAGVGVGRNHPKPGHDQALALKLQLEFGLGLGRQGRLAVQEQQSGGKAGAELDPGFPGNGLQELLRPLEHQPAAVPGLAVGGDRTAMGRRFSEVMAVWTSQ